MIHVLICCNISFFNIYFFNHYFQDQIKEIEKEKLEVVDSLSNENIKNAELENIVKELNIKISDLQNDLDIKKEFINSFNAEMSNCKEDYEVFFVFN